MHQVLATERFEDVVTVLVALTHTSSNFRSKRSTKFGETCRARR